MTLPTLIKSLSTTTSSLSSEHRVLLPVTVLAAALTEQPGWAAQLNAAADPLGDLRSWRTALLARAPWLDGYHLPLTRWLDGDLDATHARAVAKAAEYVAREDLPALLVEQDVLGVVYEELRSSYDRSSGGAFFTPLSLARLVALCTAGEGGITPGATITDPTSGTGTMIYGTALALRNKKQDPHDYTWVFNDIDRLAIALAGVNALVWELGTRVVLSTRNTLTEPLNAVEQAAALQQPPVTEHRLAPADVVVANPPYGVPHDDIDTWATDGYGRHLLAPKPAKTADLAFLAHIATALSPGGRAGVLLPMGALFRKGSEGQTRQALIEAGLFEAVIALPGGLFQSTSIPVALVMLAKDSSTGVQMVDASAVGTKKRKQVELGEGDIKKLQQACAGKKADGVPWLQLAAKELQDADLSPRRYVSTVVEQEVDLPGAIAALRAAEAETARAGAAFWAEMAKAGYAA